MINHFGTIKKKLYICNVINVLDYTSIGSYNGSYNQQLKRKEKRNKLTFFNVDQFIWYIKKKSCIFAL